MCSIWDVSVCVFARVVRKTFFFLVRKWWLLHSKLFREISQCVECLRLSLHNNEHATSFEKTWFDIVELFLRDRQTKTSPNHSNLSKRWALIFIHAYTTEYSTAISSYDGKDSERRKPHRKPLVKRQPTKWANMHSWMRAQQCLFGVSFRVYVLCSYLCSAALRW